MYSFCVYSTCACLHSFFYYIFLGLQLFITLTSSIITNFKQKIYKINVFLSCTLRLVRRRKRERKRHQRGRKRSGCMKEINFFSSLASLQNFFSVECFLSIKYSLPIYTFVAATTETRQYFAINFHLHLIYSTLQVFMNILESTKARYPHSLCCCCLNIVFYRLCLLVFRVVKLIKFSKWIFSESC